MTDEKLSALFDAFAQYYWSVPVVHVVNKIADWHSDVTVKQVERVINKCNDLSIRHSYYVTDEGVDEPELVAEHLFVLDEDDFDKFIAARIDVPFCDCTEDFLLNADSERSSIPEAKAIIEFGKSELGLDDEWTQQLIDDCILNQPYAILRGTSWVMDILMQERFGKIHFRTIEQVERFRELGNLFYQVSPNPVLRGWKPVDLGYAPKILDDIPERVEDIPDDRALREKLFAPFGGREKVSQMLMQQLSEMAPKRGKIGRNEPCPCGSGLKYKKCTCALYHSE